MLKEYSNIKELIMNIERDFKVKIVDAWQENKYYVLITDGNIFTLEDKVTKTWSGYGSGVCKIKVLMPI